MPINPQSAKTAISKNRRPKKDYQFVVKGCLKPHWSEWFEDMKINNTADGNAIISGPLNDQAAVHGIIAKIRDLGLQLLSFRCLDEEENTHGKL
jgi:hypothetical protein